MIEHSTEIQPLQKGRQVAVCHPTLHKREASVIAHNLKAVLVAASERVEVGKSLRDGTLELGENRARGIGIVGAGRPARSSIEEDHSGIRWRMELVYD